MAKGSDAWKAFVPEKISEYMEKNNLVERFKKQFGLETLSTLDDRKYLLPETSRQEKAHTMEV